MILYFTLRQNVINGVSGNNIALEKRFGSLSTVVGDEKLTSRGSLSTVVGDEKLTSREDLIGLLFFYV